MRCVPRRRRLEVKAIRLRHPAGIDHLKLEELAEPGALGPGEVLVRVPASA